MDSPSWTTVAAFVAAGVSILNILMTRRLARRSETIAWGRARLPELMSEFWQAAAVMERGITQMYDQEDDAGDDVSNDNLVLTMEGFTGMAKVVDQMDLEAPSRVAHAAVIYMDALDHVRMSMELAENKAERQTLRWSDKGRHPARQEFLNACREVMGLDSISIADLNRARGRAISTHPRINRRHEQALARLHEVQKRGPKWWIRRR